MNNLSKPAIYLAAALSSISSCWAAGTSVCVENAFGDTRRVNNVPVVFRPINANTADFVVVASGTLQEPNRSRQWAFVENGGEFFGHNYSDLTIFIAPGGNAELDGGADHRVYVQAGGTLNCTHGGGHVRIDYEPNAVLVGCRRFAHLNRVAATKSFERCSSTTPVDRIWGTPKITVTRNGTKVNFANNTRVVNDWSSWVVEEFDSDAEPFVKTVATSTNPNGFTANLPPIPDTTANLPPIFGNRRTHIYRVRLISHDSVFVHSFMGSELFE
ncbi:MAG: hypothetical protein V3V18_02115 [Methylococcales bacterium]